MFSELPKIFDKSFVIGFFIPSLVFTFLEMLFFDNNIVRSVANIFRNDILLGISILAIVSWLGGVFLLVLNSVLYRFLEGYGVINPMRALKQLELYRYRRICSELKILDQKYLDTINAGTGFPENLKDRRTTLMYKLAYEFPDSEKWVLPTAFGNIIRAFETYPRVMYGVEGVQGWTRLLTIIPKEFKDSIDTAKSFVDFWANLTFLNLLLLIQVGEEFFRSTSINILPLAVFSSLLLVSNFEKNQSALGWGEYVKSAFDIFLSELEGKLRSVKSKRMGKDFWTRYSQAIIFRSSESLTIRKRLTRRKIQTRK